MGWPLVRISDDMTIKKHLWGIQKEEEK